MTNGEHFTVYWNAYLAAKRPEGQPFDERRRDARIKKALCHISLEKDGDTKDRYLPVDASTLLTLEAPDLQRLLEYIETFPGWNPVFVDVVVEAYDALDAATKVAPAPDSA